MRQHSMTNNSFFIIYDPLKASKRLVDAGLDQKAAEAIAEDIKLATDHQFEYFATKSDLKELALAMKSDLKELESAMKSDLQKLESAMRSDLKELESDLRGEMRTEFAKMYNRFDAIDARFELLEHKLIVKLGLMLCTAIAILESIKFFS